MSSIRQLQPTRPGAFPSALPLGRKQLSMLFIGFIGGKYNPLTQAIYGTLGGGPDGIEKYDVSTGPITSQTNDPYWGDYPICGPTWLSPDDTRIYTACSTVFRASNTSAVEMTYASTLQGLTNVQSVASSASLNLVAAIPSVVYYLASTSPSDNEIWLYTNDYLNPTGHMLMPDFVVNGTHYQAHGKQAFFNKASSSLYVVMQADNKSGLLYDYAVYSIPMSNAPACSVTLGTTSASIPSSGGFYSSTITAASTCEYQATSDSNWIEISADNLGTGNYTLNYEVKPNQAGSTRTGSITVGGTKLNISQDGTPNSTAFNPLSYHVVSADYSKAIDRVITISAAPNQLHIYDPVSQADQIVPLNSTPFSLSVGPDGTHAAVGHDSAVSYVNLQTAQVEQVFAVQTDVHSLLLAGNGYIYAFTANAWGSLFAIQMSTGTVTPVSAIYDGRVPRLSASGTYMYLGNNSWPTKWNISAGVPTLTEQDTNANLCADFWLSQDGGRIYTSCGTVYRTSDTTSLDFTPNGSFSAAPIVNWAANSSTLAETAVLVGLDASVYGSPSESTLQMYGDAALALLSKQSLPGFQVGGSYYQGFGQYAFWNSSATKLFILEQAASASLLQSDYGIFTINETANPSGCTFSLDNNSAQLSAVGGTATFNVKSQSGCNWSTYLGGSTWLTLASGATGNGNGSVTVATPTNNSGAARSVSVSIAGQSVTVNQDPPCSYQVSPNSVSLAANGGTGAIAVTTGKGCPWTVTSSTTWLTVTAGATGTGNGSFSYSVAPNTTSNYEYGSLSIAGNVAYSGTSLYFYVVGSAAPTALRFVPVTPCRVADTRLGNGSFGGPILLANSTREFDIPYSSCGIPSTAQAYSLNVTVVPTTGLSYLTAYPSGKAIPYTSLLNSDGRVKAGATIMPAGTNGGVSIYVTDTTHVVLDINGYFVPASLSAGLQFYPVTPCRLVDTRLANGPLGGPSMAAGEKRTLPVLSSSFNVPTTAQAYSLNYTVVPKVNLSYLTTWPTGQSQPVVSTLNAPHSVTANAAIVPTGANGSIDVYTTDITDVIVDINGYFAPPASGGLSLYTMSPCRALDTRLGSGPVTGMTGFNALTSGCSFPGTVQAYVLNATVVPNGPLWYLSLWANGQTQPVVSTTNSDGSVVSNLALVPTLNGSIELYTTNATDLVLDFSGYLRRKV